MSLTDEQVWFLDGLLDAWDDLPDGAWQAACEDSIRACGKFKDDPFDVWIAWVEATSIEREREKP